MPAVLFGSISTIADTSELQRTAFNDAFAKHGLDWSWGHDEYVGLLASSGGAARIADYAEARGETVDAAAVHATKSDLFRTALADAPPPPRPGVVETIGRAREAGVRVGLVTTTSPDNVAALLAAVTDIAPADFDVIVDSTRVDEPKPGPQAYAHALQELGEAAEACVAIEDNLGGVRSADAAGVRCVAFPNANTAGHDFAEHDRVEALDPVALLALVAPEGPRA